MKRLTLLRHAKSSWDDPVQRDFDRPLNAKGLRAARTMGDYCRREGLAWDHVISSPAVRCVETLDGFWEGYGKALKPVWGRRVYLASIVVVCLLALALALDPAKRRGAGDRPADAPTAQS